MLRGLTKQVRRRIGRVLALAYLACVIMPPISLTFADPAVAAHCLTEDHHAVATVHVHADGTTHVHDASHSQAKPHDHAAHGSDPAAPHDTGKGVDGKCCGLFCFSAAVADVSLPIT